MLESEVVSLRLDKDLLSQLKMSIGEMGVSEFIRRAIKKELGLLNNSSNELANILKHVESLNIIPTEQKVADIEIKMQIVFEEIRKQNQLLSLIHSRISQSSELTKLIVDNQFEIGIGDKIIDEVRMKIEAEIKKIGLTK